MNILTLREDGYKEHEEEWIVIVDELDDGRSMFAVNKLKQKKIEQPASQESLTESNKEDSHSDKELPWR